MMMWGKPKLKHGRNWQEKGQELLLRFKNKQGKWGLTADWNKNTMDIDKAELLNAFFDLVFTNKVSQTSMHRDRVQRAEKITTTKKKAVKADWHHKSLEKSWLTQVYESRWDAYESVERAGWCHVKVIFYHHGHRDQRKSQMPGVQDGLTQHPRIPVWSLWSRWVHYQLRKKCLDSGISLYFTWRLLTIAVLQGFILRSILFVILIYLPMTWRRWHALLSSLQMTLSYEDNN